MGTKKILVVDYDQSTLATLRQVLTGEGYEVILAGDGQVGWDKYNQEDPDLVLMEAMLSKIHGFELCQRITSVHERRVPVFIMTGVYKDRVYRTEALRSYGASEYFEKPLKMAEILTSIEAVIGKPEPEPAPEPEPEPDLAPGYAEASAAAAAFQEVVRDEPRKPEKPKAVEEDTGWAFDLEQLERDVPKIMADPPARPEKRKDAKGMPPEDDIDLVTAALRSFPQVKAEPPRDHNNNGNDGVDIDNILKSALADFDLSAEKKRIPRTAPPVEKPKPAPPRPPVVSPPPPERAKPAPQREVPRPPQPARPVEIPRVVPPAPKPVPAPPPPPPAAAPVAGPPVAPVSKPRAEERSGAESRPPAWEGPAPAAAPDELRRSVIEDAKLRQKIPTGLFDEVHEKKSRPGFPPLVAGGVVVVVLAVAGFFLFRPKPQPSAPVSAPVAAAAVLPEMTEEKAPETILLPPPEEKPEPKPAAPAPKKASGNSVSGETTAAAEDTAALIAPIQPRANPGLALQTPVKQKPEEKKPEPPPVKMEEAAPPDTGGTEAAAEVLPAPPVPVKEGDLVDLIEVDIPPSVVKRAEPVYPQGALRLGVEGPITVNALIDETGKVLDVAILRGMKDDRGLEKAAQTAVKKWKFDPARKNGVNVKVWMPVVVVFKLGDDDGELME